MKVLDSNENYKIQLLLNDKTILTNVKCLIEYNNPKYAV